MMNKLRNLPTDLLVSSQICKPPGNQGYLYPPAFCESGCSTDAFCFLGDITADMNENKMIPNNLTYNLTP